MTCQNPAREMRGARRDMTGPKENNTPPCPKEDRLDALKGGR